MENWADSCGNFYASTVGSAPCYRPSQPPRHGAPARRQWRLKHATTLTHRNAPNRSGRLQPPHHRAPALRQWRLKHATTLPHRQRSPIDNSRHRRRHAQRHFDGESARIAGGTDSARGTPSPLTKQCQQFCGRDCANRRLLIVLQVSSRHHLCPELIRCRHLHGILEVGHF